MKGVILASEAKGKPRSSAEGFLRRMRQNHEPLTKRFGIGLRSLAALERKGHPPLRIKSHAACCAIALATVKRLSLTDLQQQTLQIFAFRVINGNGVVEGVAGFGEDFDFAFGVFGGGEDDFLK